jgi:hypothetical protein
MEKLKKEFDNYRLAVIKQMVQLATAGFGLAAALAWNQLIKAFIDEYIRPALGMDSGIISLIIYAIAVTVLAVFVTLRLSQIAKSLEEEQKKLSA